MSIQSEAHFFTTRYHTKPLTSRLLGKEAADTQGFPAVSDGGSETRKHTCVQLPLRHLDVEAGSMFWALPSSALYLRIPFLI